MENVIINGFNTIEDVEKTLQYIEDSYPNAKCSTSELPPTQLSENWAGKFSQKNTYRGGFALLFLDNVLSFGSIYRYDETNAHTKKIHFNEFIKKDKKRISVGENFYMIDTRFNVVMSKYTTLDKKIHMDALYNAGNLFPTKNYELESVCLMANLFKKLINLIK